jgi:hypothetical protein
MHVTLAPTTPADHVVLANLWQLYVHDFSEHMDLPLRDDGRFEGRAFDAWWVDPWRHAFLLRVDGGLAGFALIEERSRLTGASGVHGEWRRALAVKHSFGDGRRGQGDRLERNGLP